MGLQNFKGKGNSNGFAKNPQNINKKGRPRKGFSYVNEQLLKKGYNLINKQDYNDFVRYMINLPEEELKKISTDKTLPMYMRLMINEMRDSRTRSAFMRDIRDFMFGKADENVNHTIKARVLTPEEIKQHLKDLKNNY